MPRITNITQLERAMKDLQNIFVEQQNVDVSISRGKFKDWSDTGYGNKTLLFQSLYTKGIPIAELAKWLSPTQNQGQVRNAVVKINDIEYVQSIIGARPNAIEDFKRILKQGADSSMANAYYGSIRYWWINRGGSEERVVRTPSTRTPRTTTPSEPTTTNGGTTAITQGVLDSCYHIIRANFSSIKWWASNRIVSQTPEELANSWDEFLTGRLLNTNNSLLTNPSLPSISQGLSFWRSQNDVTKFLLQKFALIVLFDLNDFNRVLTFRVLKTDNQFLISFAQRFGQQNTPAILIADLLRRMPAFRSIMKFDASEIRLIQRVYLGRDTQGRTTTTRNAPDTAETEARLEAENEARREAENEARRTTTTATASETAANTLIRNIPFENTTFGIEIEYFHTPPNVVIRETKKLGIKTIELTGEIHETVQGAWKIVHDGSVSDVLNNGKEFVSPILKGKKGLLEMRKALMAMANAGAFMHEKCGMHLHFGAKDLTLQQWKNLLFNYDGFQPLIDKIVPQYRRNNGWSKRLSSVYNFKNQVNAARSFRDLQLIFLEAAGVSTNQSVYRDYRSSARYYAVNLMAYGKQGTVEFRQYGANIEVDSITAWVLLMHYIFEVSKKRILTDFSFKNIQNLVPVALSTWIHNRIFDLSNPTESIVPRNYQFEDRN